MEAVFLKCLNMGIAAGWVILAVLLLRLLLRKAPKAVRCALWILVAVRLVCPFSIESVLSLIPSAQTVPPEIAMARKPAIESGIHAVNDAVNPVIASSLAPGPGASVNPMQIILFLVSRLWAAGVAAGFLYAFVSWLRLRRRVAAAMRLEGNLWLCDQVQSPFIFGILSPRIYLPSSLGNPERSCVIAHERAHLRRRDHWWKPLGFALLAVYWFQPLCWIAYLLLCRDIELVCDESVVRNMEDAQKKAYASALLSCSMARQGAVACPLAFGEVGVKERVRGVLAYKKPALWIVAAAIAACAIAAVCFLTDPKEPKKRESIYGARYTVAEVLYDAPWYNAVYAPENAPDFVFTSEAELLQRNFGGIMGNNPVWNRVEVFHESDLTAEGLFGLFAFPAEGPGMGKTDTGETADSAALAPGSAESAVPGKGAAETESAQQADAGTGIDGLREGAWELLQSIEHVWRVDSGRGSNPYNGMTCYLVAQTQESEVLLAAFPSFSVFSSLL